MKTKELINRTLNRSDLREMKLLTTMNIAYKLLHIFRSHIGEMNSISHMSLFRKVYGRSEEITLSDELRWEYVRRAMHLCRQRTKCFIGHKFEKGIWKYFVVESESDTKYFYNTLERNISRMRAMQRKALKSVNEKWYKIDWINESKKMFTYEKIRKIGVKNNG